MKKFIAYFMAAFVAMVGVVASASPASAHHNTIRAEVVCSDAKYLVKWFVTNSEGITETVTASNRAVVPVGSTLSANQTKRFDEVVAAKQNLTLTLSSRWSNGQTATNSGTLSASAFPNNCKPVQPEDKVLHEEKAGCDLSSIGLKPGAAERDGTETYVWDGSAWVLSGNPVWDAWTQTSTYTVNEYRALCTPPCDDVCALPTLPVSNGNVVCDGTLSGGTYNNVTVKPGSSCSLVDVYVNGSVTANGARNLFVSDSVIVGNVKAFDVFGDVYMGSKSTCRYDPLIGGSLIVKRSHNVLLCDLTVCKTIKVQNNDGKITLRNNRASLIKIVGNRNFVADAGDNSHNNLSVIRLFDNEADATVIKKNAPRKVSRR